MFLRIYSKFAGDPAATLAFQKVAFAYSVLAGPSRRRRYDAAPAEFVRAQGGGNARAEETLRGVVLGVFNDFLDGDMEVVRTLLRTCCLSSLSVFLSSSSNP